LPLIVRRDNPLTVEGWNTRIAFDREHNIFHTAEWAGVLADTYGFAPICFTAGRGDEPEAVFPVMEVASRLTGRRGVSLPFTDHCEPLGSSEAVSAAMRDALEFGRTRGWRYLECRGGGRADFLKNAAPSVSFHGHALDLERDTDRLFARLDGSVRRAIRKAEKSGLTIEFSTSLSAVHNYYQLHCITRRHHGLPPQPFRFFEAIHRRLVDRGLGAVVSARLGDQVVAAAVFLKAGARATYKFGASDRRFQETRANNLVMWEAIRRFASEGAAVLDFGRTSLDNEGLRRFKRGWGAREFRINYYRYDLRRNAFVTEPDRASGWHTRVFRLLPIPLARTIGTLLYKHAA